MQRIKNLDFGMITSTKFKIQGFVIGDVNLAVVDTLAIEQAFRPKAVGAIILRVNRYWVHGPSPLISSDVTIDSN